MSPDSPRARHAERPEPGAAAARRRARRRRDALIGGVCIALTLAGVAAYLVRSAWTPAPQPASVRDADARLRADLASKNPPPAPSGPVEVGGGLKVER